VKKRCFNFAVVRSKKFEAKISDFFSRECTKRKQNGSDFASFRFKAKIFSAKPANPTPGTGRRRGN
jgi:hypothetical protein